MPDADTRAGSVEGEEGRTASVEREEKRVGSNAGPLTAEGNPLGRWLLVQGNRWVVSGVALGLVGLGLVGIGAVWTDELVRLFTETQVVQTILVAFLSGIILLVSVAVSVNSIVLSQEITALGDQEEEIDETFAFRDSVQAHTDAVVSPARPAAFLQVIFEAIRTDVQELLESIPDDGSALRDRTENLRDDVVSQVDAVDDRLEAGEFGTSKVLFAGIQYDYSRQVYAVRRLRTEHGDALTDDQRVKLDELLTVLKHFTIGREYFKTLYFKRELANLSRGLLLISFPAIVFLSFALLSLRAGLVPELEVVGTPSIIPFVGVTYVAGLAPYTLFSAYVLRTATITIKTLAAGPFILEEDGGGAVRVDDEP